MTPRFKASIVNGKFIYENPEALAQRVSKFNNCEVWVTITKKTKIRSLNQNRYYWGVIISILSKELGYLEEEIHDSLKFKFLLDNTKKIPLVVSTTDLTTVEFEEYQSKIRMWASSELNIYIPEPNEVPFEY
jgi:hypothetical protein